MSWGYDCGDPTARHIGVGLVGRCPGDPHDVVPRLSLPWINAFFFARSALRDLFWQLLVEAQDTIAQMHSREPWLFGSFVDLVDRGVAQIA